MVHWRDHPRWDKCIYVGVSPRQLLSGRAWPRSLASYSTGRRSQAQLVAPPGLHGEAQSNLQWTTQELLYAVPAARADWSQAPPGFDHLLEHQLVSEVGIPFFSSGVADHALRLGPYMRISYYRENFNMDTGGRMRIGKSCSPNTKHHKQRARRRSPSQICVSPSQGQQSKQRKGQEPNRNIHKRFANYSQGLNRFGKR